MRHFEFLHRPVVPVRTAILSGSGVASALILLTLIGDYAHVMIMMAPFGASCVLLFCIPLTPYSQPINVVGGHVVAAVVGLSAQSLLPDAFWMASVAVGLATTAMLLLRLVHPPAGGTAYVAYTASSGWLFLLTPVLMGSFVLVILGIIYHRLSGAAYHVVLPPRE